MSKKKRKNRKKRKYQEIEQSRLERVSLSKCLTTKVKPDKKKYTRREKHK